MRASRGRASRGRARWVAAAAALAAYAWWGSGLRSFSPLAYLAIGLPEALTLFAYACRGGLSPSAEVTERYRRSAGGAGLARAFPWAGLLLAAGALEVIALALGGRSPAVPTLSTELDRLLDWRVLRGLLLAGWLLLGLLAVAGLGPGGRRALGREREVAG